SWFAGRRSANRRVVCAVQAAQPAGAARRDPARREPGSRLARAPDRLARARAGAAVERAGAARGCRDDRGDRDQAAGAGTFVLLTRQLTEDSPPWGAEPAPVGNVFDDEPRLRGHRFRASFELFEVISGHGHRSVVVQTHGDPLAFEALRISIDDEQPLEPLRSQEFAALLGLALPALGVGIPH